VISRTSTQHYKSAPTNLPEIAKQLGVTHILEGSVQKSGDAVRVNVQLIKAANDSHLWADSFDRKLTDILSIESEWQNPSPTNSSLRCLPAWAGYSLKTAITAGSMHPHYPYHPRSFLKDSSTFSQTSPGSSRRRT
jgi:hypothetical protein